MGVPRGFQEHSKRSQGHIRESQRLSGKLRRSKSFRRSQKDSKESQEHLKLSQGILGDFNGHKGCFSEFLKGNFGSWIGRFGGNKNLVVKIFPNVLIRSGSSIQRG